MSDPTTSVTAPTPGARLKAERERRGISAQKTADEMHLEAWVIDALEAGDYARIGPAVYAKGHLRKYATLLDLPVAEIMKDFHPVQPATVSRDVSRIPLGSRHNTPQLSRVVSPGQAAASLAAVILLIAVVWWQPWHLHARAPAADAPAAASAVAETREQSAADLEASDGPVAAMPPAPVSAQDYAPRTSAAAGADVAVGAAALASTSRHAASGSAMMPTSTMAAGSLGAADAAAAASGPGAGRARLRLSFTADSWVDVRDASGNRAYTGNGSANTVKTIAGAAPLHVYLRSANGVQLEINGRAVAIGPQFFSGDVARFEAGADGVLRRDASRPEPAAARPPG